MKTMSPVTMTIVESEPLTLRELARAVGAEEGWVVQLAQRERLGFDDGHGDGAHGLHAPRDRKSVV